MVVARGRVVVADAPAQALGIIPGQRLSTALGLSAQLAVEERRPGAEQATLQGLACWAAGYSPEVSLSPPGTLLLEIAGCLRLFGGLPALLQRMQAGLRAQGLQARLALAGTPLAATWLTGGQGEDGSAAIPGGEGWQDRLSRLPLPCTDWPEAVVSRLMGLGLNTLGDLEAIPRGALGPRVGMAVLQSIERAWGRLPDPRPALVFPDRFAEKLELPGRVDVVEGLRFGLRRLCHALGGWLQARGAGIRVGELHLEGAARGLGRASLSLPLHFASPTGDTARLLRVAEERLAAQALPFPVEILALHAPTWELLPQESGQLWGNAGGSEPEQELLLLERLRARLGGDVVQGLTLVEDHRPEAAQAWHPLEAVSPMVEKPGSVVRPPLKSGPLRVDRARMLARERLLQRPPLQRWRPGQRPLWLLAKAQPLWERSGMPCRKNGERLRLLRGPERIEGGWWGEAGIGEEVEVGEVRRDYFVAEDGRGRRYWVFRTRGGWFLQGLFA